jgi:hypothetical protein
MSSFELTGETPSAFVISEAQQENIPAGAVFSSGVPSGNLLFFARGQFFKEWVDGFPDFVVQPLTHSTEPAILVEVENVWQPDLNDSFHNPETRCGAPCFLIHIFRHLCLKISGESQDKVSMWTAVTFYVALSGSFC